MVKISKETKETKGKSSMEMYRLSTMKEVKEFLEKAQKHGLTTEVVTAAIWFAQKYPEMDIKRIIVLAEGEWIK